MYGWLAEDWSTYLVHEASIPLKPGDPDWRLLASLDPASLPAISAAASAARPRGLSDWLLSMRIYKRE